MTSSQTSFHKNLRLEVDNAGKRYQQARLRVLALTAGEDKAANPALPEATEALAQAVRAYISTLRRLAHYAANGADQSARHELPISA
jgi:hypothetical protein